MSSFYTFSCYIYLLFNAVCKIKVTWGTVDSIWTNTYKQIPFGTDNETQRTKLVNDFRDTGGFQNYINNVLGSRFRALRLWATDAELSLFLMNNELNKKEQQEHSKRTYRWRSLPERNTSVSPNVSGIEAWFGTFSLFTTNHYSPLAHSHRPLALHPLPL